jgi:hypothetical protein
VNWGAGRLIKQVSEPGGGSGLWGERLDALNSLDDGGPPAEPVNPFDQAAQAFRSASQRVNEAIKAMQEPGMPLDVLSRWTRQAPLQALAVAFLVGVLFARRR